MVLFVVWFGDTYLLVWFGDTYLLVWFGDTYLKPPQTSRLVQGHLPQTTSNLKIVKIDL